MFKIDLFDRLEGLDQVYLLYLRLLVIVVLP